MYKPYAQHLGAVNSSLKCCDFALALCSVCALEQDRAISLPPMRIIAVVLMLAVAGTSGATEQAPWDAVRDEAIRAHVEFLADDLLEGRATASRGYDIAARYVATQFRAAGLFPAGDHGRHAAPDETLDPTDAPGGDKDTARAYYQHVKLLEATPVLPGSSAEYVDQETHTFEYGTDYLPSADYLAASSSLTAPLAFAGFGVQAPQLNYDDFTDIDLKGRIAVVLSGAPARFPLAQRVYHAWHGRKFELLIEHGAVGVVIVDSPEDLERIPWKQRVAMSWVPRMRLVDEADEPWEAYPELKLRFRFSHAAAARLFAEAERDLEEALARAERGEAQNFPLPGLLTLSATTGLRRTDSVNVLGVLPGADPSLQDEYVVVTAHLDHLGRGPAIDGDNIYNGAHDNAVGVGILLEMARALSASGVRPRRSVLFAALTAEEKGLLGSDHLARHPPPEARALVANLNIDMPMPFARTRDLIGIGMQHSTLGSIAARAAAAQGYRLTPAGDPELMVEHRSLIRGDHFSFIRQGIPSIVLSNGERPRDAAIDLAQIKRTYRERHHHEPSDELRLPIDYAAAADLARVNLRIVLEAANAPVAPRWRNGDFFGETFSRPAAD